MRSAIIFTLIILPMISVASFATIINIPDDYPTIQQGINASTDGDTVLVQPGTYVENINFNGHNIVLGSLYLTTGDTTYIPQTIIDGDSSGSVVTFESGEDSTAVIMGFTIQNGFAELVGGIYCAGADPIIISNNIFDNRGNICGGIYCVYAEPTILNNKITNNKASLDIGDASAGAIYALFSSPKIAFNSIMNNLSADITGAALKFINGSPYLLNNTIVQNNGDGISIVSSNVDVINTVISRNTGMGIMIVRNRINLLNSVLWANDSFEIGRTDDSIVNIYYSDKQGGWEGEGNIDVDPLFRDPENGDFHLMSTACGDLFDSPCIDTGSPAILDSLLACAWGLGTILSDMGAYGGGDSATVAIDDLIEILPARFALLQNFPNPFNPSTTIRYSLPEQSDVRIEIYNILGQMVATLFDGVKQPGYHSITWNAGDFPTGVYFARLRTDSRSENIKMVLLK